MRIALTYFTREGELLAGRLMGAYSADWMVRDQENLPAWTENAFRRADAILFIGAAGIAVREIAPLVKDKLRDPAVLVIDSAGKYVIPILSGHYGGGNVLARALADLIGAEAVITTASDEEGTFQVDELARRSGLWITSHEKLVQLSTHALNGGPIRIFSELPIDDKGERTPDTDPDKAVILTAEGRNVSVAHSDRSPEKDKVSADAVILDSAMGLDPDVIENPFQPLYLYPRHFAIGIGCRKELDPAVLKAHYDKFLEAHQIDSREVAYIATIDIKSEELAILQLAEDYQIRLITFSAEELREAPGTFTASAFVEKTVGVDNVCERAAVLAAGEIRRISDEGKIVFSKEAGDGVTLAAAKCPDTIIL